MLVLSRSNAASTTLRLSLFGGLANRGWHKPVQGGIQTTSDRHRFQTPPCPVAAGHEMVDRPRVLETDRSRHAADPENARTGKANVNPRGPHSKNLRPIRALDRKPAQEGDGEHQDLRSQFSSRAIHPPQGATSGPPRGFPLPGLRSRGHQGVATCTGMFWETDWPSRSVALTVMVVLPAATPVMTTSVPSAFRAAVAMAVFPLVIS